MSKTLTVDGSMTKDEFAASRESMGRCLVDGEPLKVAHKVLPVAGSVREILGGMFKGEEIKNAERTGTCPNCGARTKLSGKGFITAHSVRNAPLPASKALSDTSMDVADSGARVGDPEAGAKRRTVESLGAFEAGTVMIPVKGKNGRTKLEEAPGTEENVRAAFAYWTGRKPRSESARVAQSKNVSELSRRLEAMRKGQESLSASMPDAAQDHRGPTLVKGRAETFQRPFDLPWTENTSKRSRGTMEAPLGRERFDRMITEVPEPQPKLTATQKRRGRRKQAMARLVARQSQ